MTPANETVSLLNRIDPELRAGLERYLSVVPGGLSAVVDIAERRGVYARLSVAHPAPEDVTIWDQHVEVPGRSEPLRLRIYRPTDTANVAGAVLYVHGGGMVMGTPEADDPHAVRIAREAGTVVVSVDYALAPEHPFPAPLDDVSAALAWLNEELSGLSGRPTGVAVYGVSSGGALAGGAILRNRDEGGPAPVLQALIYPMLDDRCVTRSMSTNTGFGAWSKEANVQGWDAYLNPLSHGAEGVSPYAAPARADDLSGLPPLYLDVGELDLFVDEDVEYAARMLRAGVPVELHLCPGSFHTGENWAPTSAISLRIWSYRIDALRRALHASSTRASK